MNKKNHKDKKYIVFDLDGTLTKSRSVISHDMTDALRKVEGLYEVVVISGAQKSQMINQIPWLDDSLFTIMGQSGNDTRKEGMSLWKNHLSFDDLHKILFHIAEYRQCIMNDALEIRGGQVSLSLLGHNASKVKKKEFDPYGDIRRTILGKFPFENGNLSVKIGGTTCFDYTKNGWEKKGNLERLFEMYSWDLKDAVYIGDQLYEGGNDEDVMEIMDCAQVENPDKTLEFINNELL